MYFDKHLSLTGSFNPRTFSEPIVKREVVNLLVVDSVFLLRMSF
jgi:hypothetical protein